MIFETLESKNIYQGRVFDLRQDRVRLPDGHETSLDIVSHGGAVTLVPVDAAGNIWFIRQYRYAAQEELLELPAGTLEKGEEPVACALRELREEIGMGAHQFRQIGGFYLAPGYSTEFLHIFLAQGLYPDALAGDEDEFLVVEKLPASQMFSLAEKGLIRDSKTLAALFLARQYL